ncbi:anti-Muellerian hormone type-2 receptor-like [Salarias fasciatus]|uniref:anti-Muellerian hormone type-2 receptor-like n=1 Tax=Salarias fasciatus TaxID=181472 RepID=UPI001176F484|nr:anti-Muellerian hormone type-2 receptor-like [Salarias fasciatus]
MGGAWQRNQTSNLALCDVLQGFSPPVLRRRTVQCVSEGRETDVDDGVAPGHLLPYELELGATVSLETLVQHVSYMDRRPSVPEHWALLPQGPALAELLTDCWDAEPDARLSAQCVVDRLMSLQSRSSA